MKFLCTTLAVLGGALMLSGCAMETMDTGGDEGEPEAVSEAESPVTAVNKRLRNSSTSLCLTLDSALTVLSTAPCNNVIVYQRWNIVDHGLGRHSIRPTSDLTRCLQSLAPTPHQPTVGPCAAGGVAGLEAAGQLFRLLPVPPPANTYRITPHPQVMPASDRLDLTALQPNTAFFTNPGTIPSALRSWLVF